MGYIEFTPTGEILDANDLFLSITGYKHSEIKNKHHRIFCDPSYVGSKEYVAFWENLRAGKSQNGTFQRFGKNNQRIWIEANYFPVSIGNVVVKIIKIASDITLAKNALLDRNALFTALDKSLAVIEFDPAGNILTANQNFLNTVGYRLVEKAALHVCPTLSVFILSINARHSKFDYRDSEFLEVPLIQIRYILLICKIKLHSEAPSTSGFTWPYQ